jgi:hypothetical protein
MERLTLIVPYRDRATHLRTQLRWWATQSLPNVEVLLIELSAAPSEWIAAELVDSPLRYVHLPCAGPFHKTRALNLGIAIAQGNWIVPFDIDLIPIGQTLRQHWDMARSSPHLLITGYRLMHAQASLELSQLEHAVAQSAIAPEDQPTALYKHLTRAERFGVVPFFQRQRLEQIGGWDEQFIGWGGEDQDLIERYHQTLCRCPDLVYLHLHHNPQPDWNEAQLTDQNRQHYYAKRMRSH